MKRYRHYKKDIAIVLSCFGSVIEQEKYNNLKNIVEQNFTGCDVFVAYSSRMVLKELNKNEIKYKNLPQVLADVDLIGYKNIIVASINLFPTDEHQLLKEIAKGFKTFSLANIRYTNAIFSKTKQTSLFLKELNTKITQPNTANLYIIHGTPSLELGEIESINYTSKLLEYLDDNNFTCSLEGAFSYNIIKEQLIKKIKAKNLQNIQVVPMLLVSGNHYYNDMIDIANDLRSDFNSFVAKPLNECDRFNILDLKATQEIVLNNIKEEIIKLGI